MEDGIAMQAFVEAKLDGIWGLCREYGVARLER